MFWAIIVVFFFGRSGERGPIETLENSVLPGNCKAKDERSYKYRTVIGKFVFQRGTGY